MAYLITDSSVSKQGVFQMCYKIPRGIFGYGEKKGDRMRKNFFFKKKLGTTL